MNVPAAKHARDAASWAVPSDIHVARIREALRSLIDLTDLSRREIERRLVAHGVGLDLDRLLSGKFSLKVDQLLDVCRVLELHPVELFRLVFVAPDRRCPLLDRLHAVFDAGPPPIAASPATSAPAGPDNGELRSRVDRLQRAVEQMQRMPGRAVASR